MNIELIIVVIIFYILKNNSCQYYSPENRNQKLLLFLLFINEMDQCLNNKSNYMHLINNKNRYYMNYPNYTSNNSNNIINTSKINTKNNNEDNGINSEMDITINNNENDVIIGDTDDLINNSNDSFIDTNRNNIINDNDDNNVNDDNMISDDNDDPINNNDNNNGNFIGTNRNIITNNNDESSINNNKHGIINSNKDTAINNNSIIYNKKISYTDKNKDNIISRDKVINDIFNLTNSDKDIPNNIDAHITIKNNKNSSASENENFNPDNLKSKLIKPAPKIHDESSTYTNPCQKTKSIISNSISNTFKHLSLSKTITAISEFTKHFNLKAPTPLTGAKVKVPVLVGSTNITELFNGRVTFCNPIISILKVTNEIFITSKSILPSLHTDDNNAVLHYEGFLKTHLEYLEDVIIEKYEIKCDAKHYIMLIPFSGTKDLNLTDETINSPNIILKDLILDINKNTFLVDTCLEEPTKGNNYINLYKSCNLTVKAECDISLYRKKLVDL